MFFGRLLVFILSLSFSSVGLTQSGAVELDVLAKRAVAHKLHLDPVWKNLLHYYDPVGFSNKLTSFVDGSEFFLSEAGKSDSAAEIAANIRILLSETTYPANTEQSDPRCRFVERERWLREKLGLASTEVPLHCKAYRDWRSSIDAHSVTLVFPASYLNSPSSMFGHTLFRFDPKDIKSDSSLLSYSLSYAADVSKSDEDSFFYAFKGIAGGYPGKFNIVPYFKKIQEYGALENRDVWEYKLNLNPLEVERILNHAWELKGISFDYFYFRENCAYRLVELLDYARPGLEIAKEFQHTAIPASTVKSIVNAGIVESVHYRPSIGTELQHNLSLIDPKDRDWVNRLAQAPTLADSDAFLSLEDNTQHSLLLTSNLHLTYLSRRSEMSEGMVGKRFAMLQRISRYPAKKPEKPPQPTRPDKGHGTSLFALGVGSADENTFSEFTYRISYHDLLDNTNGYLRGGQIELGDFSVRNYNNGGARIEKFDIITLRSLSSWYSIFNSISWEMDAGFSRDSLLENEKMSFKLSGSAGKGLPLRDDYVVYGLLGGSTNIFTESAKHNNYVNSHAKIGVLQYNRYGTAMLELRAESLQRKSLRYTLEFGQNLVLSRDHALRLNLSLATIGQNKAVKSGKLSYRYSF